MSKAYLKIYPKTYSRIYGKSIPSISFPNILSADIVYDVQDLSTMWQDSAKTTPAAVDQPVGAQSAVGRSDRDRAQSTAMARPTLRHDGKSYYLEVSGAQSLEVPSSQGFFNYLHDGTGGSYFACAQLGIVANPLADYALMSNFNGGSSIAGSAFAYRDIATTSDRFSLWVGNTTGGQQVIDLQDDDEILPNVPQSIGWTFENIVGALGYVDGVQVASQSTLNTPVATNTISNMHFFRLDTGEFPLVGREYGCSFFTTNLTGSDLTNIQNYYGSLPA